MLLPSSLSGEIIVAAAGLHSVDAVDGDPRAIAGQLVRARENLEVPGRTPANYFTHSSSGTAARPGHSIVPV